MADQSLSTSSSQRERYTKWDDERETHYHAARTAAKQAVFFIPHLHSGMRLLDCGCGPGTITLDFAKITAPGEVVGIELDEAALALGRTRAQEQGLVNVRFETGSIYELPFPDYAFDAVFSHAVLEHLGEPVTALCEMHRVTKSGGIVGVRTPDHDGFLVAPQDPLLNQFVVLNSQWLNQNGGDIRRGKYLRKFFRQAGFVCTQVTASYESYATPETIGALANRLIRTTVDPDHPWVKAGLVDHETMKEIEAAWRRWAADPDAFAAMAWCEAVSWVE